MGGLSSREQDLLIQVSTPSLGKIHLFRANQSNMMIRNSQNDFIFPLSLATADISPVTDHKPLPEEGILKIDRHGGGATNSSFEIFVYQKFYIMQVKGSILFVF